MLFDCVTAVTIVDVDVVRVHVSDVCCCCVVVRCVCVVVAGACVVAVTDGVTVDIVVVVCVSCCV